MDGGFRAIVCRTMLLAFLLMPAPPLSAPAAAQEPQGADQPPSEPTPNGTDSEPTTTVLDKGEMQGILGKLVYDKTGKELGRITNVVVDRSAKTRAVVIDFGGFLGVGSRKIAVDWNALRFEPDTKPPRVTLDLTRDQIKAGPEYKDGQPVLVIGAAGKAVTVPDDGTSIPEQ